MPNRRGRCPLVLLMAASLVAGCGPEGAGSIKVDRKDPVIRNLKGFEDGKRPTPTKEAGKPARQLTRNNSGF